LVLIEELYIQYFNYLKYIIAKNFGKSTGFGVGLIFLSPIFFAILAFGDAEYQPAAIEA